MRFRVLQASGVVGAAATTALLLVAVAPAGAAQPAPSMGSAYGASAAVALLPGVLGATGLSVDTGKVAATNTAGPTSASVVDASLKGLVSAKVITSSAVTDKGADTSSAKLVQVALPVLGTLAHRTPVASVITSQCHASPGGITGGSDLADLDLGVIGRVSVATPNLKLGIPGVLQVIANEQIHNADGSLTVNALDITLLGGTLTGAVGSGHIVLASSTCAAVLGGGGPGATTTRTTSPTKSPAPTSRSTSPHEPGQSTGQVSIVPVGAPETGDGTLAAVIVR